jgi:hypothetical protein
VPKVVTRTRRVARRAAGSTSTAEPAPVVVAPTAAPDGGELAPVAPPVAERPKVVTRTRRAVSRPAGPGAGPAGELPGTDGTGESTAEPETTAGGDVVPAGELHVPIKKKGSRRR